MVQTFLMLTNAEKAEGLRDGSGKHGDGLWWWLCAGLVAYSPNYSSIKR